MIIIVSRRGSRMRLTSWRRARRKTPARRRVVRSTLATAGRLATRPETRRPDRPDRKHRRRPSRIGFGRRFALGGGAGTGVS